MMGIPINISGYAFHRGKIVAHDVFSCYCVGLSLGLGLNLLLDHYIQRIIERQPEISICESVCINNKHINHTISSHKVYQL